MPGISIAPAAAAFAMALAHHGTGAQDPNNGQNPPPEPPTTPAPQNPNYFNPQMAIVFDFRARLADPDPEQRHADMKEVEFNFAADVDPYLTAYAVLAVAKEDGETAVDVEEAWADYLGLGHRLDAKIGKLKGAVGRTNRNHADQLEYLDLPLVLQDFLGEEGLKGGGASLAYLFSGERFSEVSLDVLDPDDGPVFMGSRLDDPVLIGHYRTFFDFNADTSAQLGFSYASGPNGSSGHAQIFGADYTMKWQPGIKGKSWMLETEAYGANPGNGADSKFGAFAAFTYEIRSTIFATAKFDYSEIPFTSNTHRAMSFGLACKLSEFSHARLEYQLVSSNFEADKNLLTFQLQYLIGTHPAHKY